MGRLTQRVLATLLLFLLATAGALAQPRQPVWVTVERARTLEAQGEFGRAIQLYREALALNPGNPEATLGLARVFRDIADPAIAQTYFDDALELRDRFQVPGYAVLVRYERARFYRDRLDHAAYERELLSIIQEDTTPTELPDDLSTSLAANGLDELLILYRSVENGATEARGMLAQQLVGMGQYLDAEDQAIRAIVEQVTTVVDALLERDPFFQFTSVGQMLDRAAEYPETREYLSSSTLFRNLYYLAAALYGSRRAHFNDIWRYVAQREESGTYQRRALQQLSSPQTEPLLVETD